MPHKNKWRTKEYLKQWYLKNREKCLASQRRYQNKNLDSLIGHILKETFCQICDKRICLNSYNKFNIICFDHRIEDCEIKVSPKQWLKSNIFNEKNKKIWDSCNFGYLCWSCNIVIPTKNRKEWLKRVTAYIECQKQLF